MRGETVLSTQERESSSHDELSSVATKWHHQQRKSDKSLMTKGFKKENAPTFDGEIKKV